MTQTCTAKDDADAALVVLRTMVAIGDSTLARVTSRLTLTQFRALRTVTEQTPVTMTRVAQELGLNPSSVTRACEKLVRSELLQRAQNPLNRREVLLAPTSKGRQIVERVDTDRRLALTAILDQLEPETRASVSTAFARFAAVATTTKSSEV